METVQERLAVYRAQNTLYRKHKQCQSIDKVVKPCTSDETLPTDTNDTELLNNNTHNFVEPSPWYITGLKILLWLLLWGFFIEVEFGMVFLIASGLFFIVYSLCGSKRKVGELSAYSVFNENCEAIDGTLTAEQFERELRYGPVSVKR